MNPMKLLAFSTVPDEPPRKSIRSMVGAALIPDQRDMGVNAKPVWNLDIYDASTNECQRGNGVINMIELLIIYH